MNIEELLKRPYWIIDILPKRVPPADGKRYFAAEHYFLRERGEEIVRKKAGLLLKLNCYCSFLVSEGESENRERDPEPEKLAGDLRSKPLNILAGDCLICSDPDDTWLTVFGPDEEMLQLLRLLAASEGLFVWKGAEDP